MFRKNLADLDVLDSPIISPAPMHLLGGGMPGSAIAENIFNDPNAWGTAEDDDIEGEEDEFGRDFVRFGLKGNVQDPMAWLAEEIEKFRTNSAGSAENNGREKEGVASLKSFKWGNKLGAQEINRPISLGSLFNNGDNFIEDIQQQLSKIIESGEGINDVFEYPTPTSSSGSESSTESHSMSPSALNISTTLEGQSFPQTPIASPIAVYSASTTLSFLEWYGIYPDSPRLDQTARRSLHSKMIQQRASLLQTPSRSSPLTRPSTPLNNPKSGVRLSASLDQESKIRSDVVGLDDPFSVKPPPRRASPIPPPGLAEPAAMSHSVVESISAGPPTEALPETPPPYIRALPEKSSPDKTSLKEQPTTTPSKLTVPLAETPIRRLPSVPERAVTPPVKAMAPMQTTPAKRAQTPPVSLAAAPPTRIAITPVPPATPDPLARARSATPSAGSPRPLSSARSPPVGPAGPRSRSTTPQMRERGLSLSGSPVGVNSPAGHHKPMMRSLSAQVGATENAFGHRRSNSNSGHRPPALRFATMT